MEQNEIARQYAVKEIEHEGKWYSQEISRILDLFQLQEKVGKSYRALVSVSDYPNCILSGWTWNRVFGNLLAKDSIRNQIISFYEQKYSTYRKMLITSEYKTDEPVWVVIRTKELEPDTVYPLITDCDGSGSIIVLAINETD